MNTSSHEHWLDSVLPRHARLTSAVTTILENLLQEQAVDYLSVTGRTKDKSSAVAKLRRKGYDNPPQQLTDLSGIRVVVFFESDVKRVGEIIRSTFSVDEPNSLNKDLLLSTNQMGYRSVHFVCDLGAKRALVEEYRTLSGMKFELQVRTVLQHAWAELAHDRDYKFAGKLPKELERKLYLYAGLLEIADRGFDETAKAIDAYAAGLQEKTAHGYLDLEITSLSLDAFVSLWAVRSGFTFDSSISRDDLPDLISELHDFGITRLDQLNAIVSSNYAEVAKANEYSTTIHGLVRDWMLLKDWRRFLADVKFSWRLGDDDFLSNLMTREEFDEMAHAFWQRNRDEPSVDGGVDESYAA